MARRSLEYVRTDSAQSELAGVDSAHLGAMLGGAMPIEIRAVSDYDDLERWVTAQNDVLLVRRRRPQRRVPDLRVLPD